MIFAELQYDQDYADMHFELVEHLQKRYPDLQSGLQSDSWIWIFSGEEKVAVDTFYSMKHQVKSENPKSALVREVIKSLAEKYKVVVLDKPMLEPHEDEE